MRWSAVWILGFGLVGCSQDKVDLLLDLRTDLVPGVEFGEVRTELFDVIPATEQVAGGARLRFLEARQGDDFIRGRRVAVFRGLSRGTHVARVRVTGQDGKPFMQRIVLVTLERTSVFTVVMTRDCRGVMCPAAGDDPSLTECLNGRCVSPECTLETLALCRGLSCEVGVTCTAAAACAIAQCTGEQICLRIAGSGCSADQYCDPDQGCQPLPPEEVDAGFGGDGGGSTDARVDASADAATVFQPAVFESYLKASNTGAGDGFGYGVALSSDGSTLVVRAPGEDSAAVGVDGNGSDDSAPDSGAVYVFAKVAGAWTQQGYLKASNTGAGDEFGDRIAFSADGLTLAVGAKGEDSAAVGIDGDGSDNSAPNSGAVYVFTQSGGTWSQQAYIKSSNSDTEDNFGDSIALSSDGSTLVVGAWGEDSAAIGIDGNQADNSVLQSGAVYVFERSGGVWSQQAYIKPSNPDADDQFSGSLALSSDGSTIAASAAAEDSAATGINGDASDNALSNSGAIYIFVRSGSTWSQQAYIKAATTDVDDFLGFTALSPDGSTLAASATNEDSAATGINGDATDNSLTSSGAAYVFARDGVTWTQQAYVKPLNTGAFDWFGRMVGLSADGNTLVVSTFAEDGGLTAMSGDQTDNAVPGSGAVYVFARNGAAWAQRAYLKAPNLEVDDKFGISVAISADGATLAAGAIDEDSSASSVDGDQADNTSVDSGAVYVFSLLPDPP